MVTLAEAKVHCRLDDDDQGQDDLLVGYISAARDHLSSIDVDTEIEPLPPAIHHAILMLVAHFYQNAEATSEELLQSTPFGVDRLIAPYRSVTL